MQYFLKNIDHQSIPRTYVQNFMRKYGMVLRNGGTYVKMNPQNTPNGLAAERNIIWKMFLITFSML